MATILVIDDEQILRSFYQHLVEAHGHTAVMAENGMEALKICSERKEPFDLAIIDWVMPVMGGAAVKKWLEETYPGMPIIIASGSVDPSEVQLGSKEVFLLKPFTADRLIRAVNELVSPTR